MALPSLLLLSTLTKADNQTHKVDLRVLARLTAPSPDFQIRGDLQVDLKTDVDIESPRGFFFEDNSS